jgi:hypothetical protein
MKKVVFAFAVALLFISCSDDGETSSDVMSCRFNDDDLINFPGAVKLGNVCLEFTKNELEEKGYSVNDIKVNCVGRFYYEKCPTGSLLNCRTEPNDPAIVGETYLYDEKHKDMTCEEFWQL